MENLKLDSIVAQGKPGDSTETLLLQVASLFRTALSFVDTNVIFCNASDNIASIVRDFCLSGWKKKLF